MTESTTFKPPTTTDSPDKEGKLDPKGGIWNRISQAIWGANINEKFPEATPEERAISLINAGRDPSDKCLPLLRLYDSEEQARIDACHSMGQDGGPKEQPRQ